MNIGPPRRPGGGALRALVLCGLAAAATGGGVATPLALVAFVATWLPSPRLPERAWPFVHGGVLLATGLGATAGGSGPAFAGLTAWLLVHQGWTGRGAATVRVQGLLATLMLLLAGARSESPLLAPLLVAFCALLPITLMRAQLQDLDVAPSRALEAGVGLGAVALAAVLFVALPRLQGGYGGEAGGQGAFPDDVKLGDDALINDDNAVVARLRVTDTEGRRVPAPLYVRGRALDHFDGTTWTSSRPAGRDPGDAWEVRAEIELEPLASLVVFSPGQPLRVEGAGPVRQDGNGTFFHTALGRSLDYVTYARRNAAGPIDVGVDPAFLALPELDPRVVALSRGVAGELSSPDDVAPALTEWLAAGYRYSLSPGTPGPDPLAWFLLDGKAGHCEYFASALAVTLRLRDVPARVTTGFYSDETDESGAVVVRRGHAHAWVEVPVVGGGWAVLDATPSSDRPSPGPGGLLDRLQERSRRLFRAAVDYDMQAQFAAYGVVGKRLVTPTASGSQSPLRAGLVGMVVVLGGLFCGGALLRFALGRWFAGERVAARPTDAWVRGMADARALVRRRGWPVPADLGALEAADWLTERVGPAAEPFARLARSAYAARYGGARGPDPEGEVRACLRELARVPKAAPR